MDCANCHCCRIAEIREDGPAVSARETAHRWLLLLGIFVVGVALLACCYQQDLSTCGSTNKAKGSDLCFSDSLR